VILAWCGDIDAAREEMSRLEVYHVSDVGALELINRRMLIDRIAAGDLPLPLPSTED
jgi:hypothetical protein